MVRKVQVIGYGDRSDDKAWRRPWEFLLAGDTERALSEMGEMYNRNICPSTLITYGAIMLYANAYQAAHDHFFEVIKKHLFDSESEYTYAGIALWCMDDVRGAITMWKEGMNAHYAPGGVCIQTPMLLLAASILEPGSITRVDAESALSAKAGDPMADGWPGTLSQYVSGIINLEELEASKHGHLGRRNVAGNLLHRTWLIDFYRELLRIGREEYSLNDFRESMGIMTNPTADGWKDPESFALLVRQPEYFIARHAAR